MVIAIGVGCRRGVAAAEVIALVRKALEMLPSLSFRGGEAEPGTGKPRQSALKHAPAPPNATLFTIAEKRDEAGLTEAAVALGLPLIFLDRAVLALVAGEVRSCSRRVEEMFGLPGIAETAALAGAGQGAVLLVPRLASARATCAVAGPSHVG